VCTSITSIIENANNFTLSTLLNRDEKYRTNANAAKQLALRRDRLQAEGYEPPPMLGLGDDGKCTYEVKSVASDNPEAEDG
jgi:hypothetical protein